MIALCVVIFICISGVATWKEIQERVEWGVLVLFGGGLTLSIVMKDSVPVRLWRIASFSLYKPNRFGYFAL